MSTAGAATAALIYDSPVTGTKSRISYGELRDRVARLAGALPALGVVKGDRVIIYMPMVPEAFVAMLACARLGAVHSVVFGGFAAAELAVRIDDAHPRSSSRRPAASSRGGWSRTSRCSTRRSRWRGTSRTCVILQRPQAAAALVPGRDSTGTRRRPGWRRRRACRSRRWTRSTSSTPPARPGSRRGWCAQRRPHGGAGLDDAERLRVEPGRRVLGGLGRRLGGWAFVHLLCAAPGRRDDGGLRGQAGRDARRRELLAGHRRTRRRSFSPRRRRFGRSSGRTPRASSLRGTT